MSTVASVLLSVRDTLNDHDAANYRWPDSVLIRRLNEAVVDIATRTKMFTGDAVALLTPGVGAYSLPSDFIELKEVLYKGKALPLVSSDTLRELDCDWRIATTDHEITHVVFDQQEVGYFRVYPVPSIDFINTTTGEPYGTLDTVDTEATDTDDGFGALNGDGYGIVTAVGDTVTIDSAEVNSNALIYPIYTKTPALVSETTVDMPVSANLDKAIRHFIAGTSLRNDLSASNRAFGNEELQLYERALAVINQRAKAESTRVGVQIVQYDGMG